ncbi:MAG: CPBP family intramembrane metalloprotease [Phycisphaerae bacterium]|nr:CPBP family intramembrane metalloprotease [Phycisphaerae bacterium]
MKAKTLQNIAGTQLTARLVVRAAVLLPLLATYLTSFWGNFGQQWPSWIREHCGSVMRQAMDLYVQQVTIPPGGYISHHRVLWLVVGLVMAALLPLSLAALTGRSPATMGLRPPNRWGWRMVVLSAGLTIPFAFLFAQERIAMVAPHQPPAGLQLLVMLGVSVPEHIFLTGICLASFCQGWRIPTPARLAAVEGSRTKKTLRWLGLAQPTDPGQPLTRRALAWWGLDGPSLLAITCAGLLFGIIHVGAGPTELASSFPGGIALCYLVWRSGSIWPGWLIHVFQMLMVATFILVPGGD